VIELTLERMVELAMNNSFQIRTVELNIERTQHNLRAEQAGLKSRVDLNLQTPQFEQVSEFKYNSNLGRNEIVRENTQRWQADLSIKQPVILFGRPTNGELSLNSRIYRYKQIEDDGANDVRYYNRYFVAYKQNLFQPNDLKNNLEEAELDLEDSELRYRNDVIGLIDEVSRDYLDLFEDAYDGTIYDRFVGRLEAVVVVAEGLAETDAARAIEADQFRIELANAQQDQQRAGSSFRLKAAEIKQGFQMPLTDSITLEPVMTVEPVAVDLDAAIAYARTLTPRLRQLEMNFRENEINLEETKGRQSFRMDVEVTYGREMQDPLLSDLFAEPTNSYTVRVGAYVPIWDWGRRNARIAASEINLKQTQLRIEQAEGDIASDVSNQVRNLEEFEGRALAMDDNLALASDGADAALDRYRDGAIGALELLQSLDREVTTAENLLSAYVGWRRAIFRIQRLTFYDFQRGAPALERFGIGMPRSFDGATIPPGVGGRR